MSNQFDVIDRLAGIHPGSALDSLRDNRKTARDNAQLSYAALFTPRAPGTVLLEERFAIAYFVAGVHGDDTSAAFYRDQLVPHARARLVGALSDEIRRGTTRGPYGDYPAGPLSSENEDGLHFQPSPSHADVLGRIAGALIHTHLLVFRPRDASGRDLQALLDAGWSTDDIVTLSQLVAFLSFQLRVVSGLRTLANEKTAAVAAE